MAPFRLACAVAFAAAAGLVAGTASAAAIVSNFTNYDDHACGTVAADASECWGRVGDAGSSLSWIDTGAGEGFLQMSEAGTGQWDWFVAPTKFIGDQSAFFGGTLSFDVHASAVTGTRGTVEAAAVLLHSGSDTIGAFLPSQPSAQAWNTITIALTASADWRVGSPGAQNQFPMASKPAAQDADIQAILENVTDIWILGDWGTSAQTIGLDNVILARPDGVRVPAPGGALLLATAMLALLARRRRLA
jgi:hypothetical protein